MSTVGSQIVNTLRPREINVTMRTMNYHFRSLVFSETVITVMDTYYCFPAFTRHVARLIPLVSNHFRSHFKHHQLKYLVLYVNETHLQ